MVGCQSHPSEVLVRTHPLPGQCKSLDVALRGTPGTPLISLPIWPLSDLCSVLLLGFTQQNPDAGKILQVMIDVQPLGKPFVLFVLLDRQLHSAPVAAALSPVPSSL